MVVITDTQVYYYMDTFLTRISIEYKICSGKDVLYT